jgi:hypothetical protein
MFTYGGGGAMPLDADTAKKAKYALNARDHLDYRCYMLLKEIMNSGYDGKHAEDARELINKRIDVNDKFVQAIAEREQ